MNIRRNLSQQARVRDSHPFGLLRAGSFAKCVKGWGTRQKNQGTSRLSPGFPPVPGFPEKRTTEET
jgi:hypothetical protein